MSRGTGPDGSKWALGLSVCLILIAGISGISAGRGNLGSQGSLSSNLTGGKTVYEMIGSPTELSVVIGRHVFPVTLDPNTTTTTALRDKLVSIVDADPDFAATSFVDPFDPNDVSFNITTQLGAEIPEIYLCENLPKLQTLGSGFAAGKDLATIRMASTITGLNSDPNGPPPVYTLTIRTVGQPLYVRTYTTSVAPNNTATGLNASVKADLMAAGFTVLDSGGSRTIRFPGDVILSVKNFSTDSGFTFFCSGLAPQPTDSPTLSEVGMFVLVLFLTIAAITQLRRKGRPTGQTAR